MRSRSASRGSGIGSGFRAFLGVRVCDGEEVELAPATVLFVSPDVHREGYALTSPTTVLVVGGVPGQAY